MPVSQSSLYINVLVLLKVNRIKSKINSIDQSVSRVTEEYSCLQASARVYVLERHCECSPETYRAMASTNSSTHV